jgi:hypothetical protein
MFGSAILDVATGIIFLFLMLSLICSALVELAEAYLKFRARDLEKGLKELLDDSAATGLVKDLYSHPLVNALFQGKYPPNDRKLLPTYIPARTFALALMDIVKPGGAAESGAAGAALPPPTASSIAAVVPQGGGVQAVAAPVLTTALRAALVAKLVATPNSALHKALLSLVDAAGTDPAVARQNIEDWYNASMDRVSGWFKRRTHFILFGIGLMIAAVINADAIAFTKYLSTDKDARAVIVSRAEAVAKATPQPGSSAAPSTGLPAPAPKELVDSLGWLETQAGIPFGWRAAPALDDKNADQKAAKDAYDKELLAYRTDWRRVPDDFGGWLLKIAGLLLTACAVTLGAPFWFDVLNKIMVVRSTIKPKEKSPDEPSKA